MSQFSAPDYTKYTHDEPVLPIEEFDDPIEITEEDVNDSRDDCSSR